MYNSDLTIYCRFLNPETKFHEWKKYYYDKVWFFSNQSSDNSKGFEPNNSVDVRIFYDNIKDLDINNFSIGDLIVQGNNDDIITEEDLKGKIIYKIKTIKNNNFGINKHIHLIGE